MLKIRLQRVGRKHDPSFRVVLTDSRKAASKGEKEILGTYDPRLNESNLKADRIKEWISKGAQASDTVHNLLVNSKIIEGKKKDVRPSIKVPEDAPAAEAEEQKEESKEETPKEEPKVEESKEAPTAEDSIVKEPAQEEPKVEESGAEKEAPKEEEISSEPTKEEKVKPEE